MRRYLNAVLVGSFFAMTLSTGCGDAQPPIVRVGTNVVEKSIFQGTWYMGQTVIDTQYEAGSYPGDSASDLASGLTAMPRIRWVIDENFLLAYRDYELVLGGQTGDWREHDVQGHPVAAFRIQTHFDIRRNYNTTTGEEQNTVVENSTDRRWYERKYMRVDWSQNLLPGYYGTTANLYEILGLWRSEPAPLYVAPGSQFPDSWRPRFDRMQCNSSTDTRCPEYERDRFGDYQNGELYHMSFVTQELRSPGDVPDPIRGGQTNWCTSVYNDSPNCTAAAVFVRTSFLKVSPRRQYMPTNWTDNRWDKHGFFRLDGDTMDRTTGSPGDLAYGATDFLNYSVNRHNIWKNWYTAASPRAACHVDSECSGGNTCLRTSEGRFCGREVPYSDRVIRPIVWYTTPELPAHLARAAAQVASDWNVTLMETVRQLKNRPEATYPRVSCQSTDPSGYCYCRRDPNAPSGPPLNPTCAGQYDPFESPDQARARGVQNPYDCYIATSDGTTAVGAACARGDSGVANPALCPEPDMEDNAIARGLRDADFNKWFSTKFVGSECVNVARFNTCNRATIAANNGTAEGLDCEERGDLRHKFISYVDQPGTPFLGIATMRGDPTTGETIAGDANIGGPAMDAQRTSALQTIDLMNGNLTDQEFITGEDVRSYFGSLNSIQQPNPPRIDFSVANQLGAVSGPMEATRREIDNRMSGAAGRMAQLSGAEGRQRTYSDRISALRGTDLEYRLTAGTETLSMAGVDHLPSRFIGSQLPEGLLDQASPFRVSAPELLAQFDEVESRAARLGFHMPNEYNDESVRLFVTEHQSWPRAKLEYVLNRLLYRETQVHELGHCMGLRHDFGGTADTANYADDYYYIANTSGMAMPDPRTFDTDGTPGLNTTELRTFEDRYRTTKRRRELAGIDGWANASVMDYTANWYQRIQSAGRYDHAAIAFGYGDVVEVYDNRATRTPTASINPANTPRTFVKYYAGGEPCTTDNECPYSANGARSGELLASNTASGLTQRCVSATLARPGAISTRVCSSIDNDIHALPSAGTPQWAPVDYRFCSDERATGGSSAPGTLAWCNRFDEGESYREIVQNVIESYDRSYLFTNFRRYRRSFSIGGYLFNTLIGRRLVILQNIYQDLVYRYMSDPAYRTSAGAFGFYDHFLATADIFNFYARILGQPDVGTYAYNTFWNRFEKSSSFPDTPGAQVRTPIGMGRYFNSIYQGGLTGISRVERIGTFYEKVIALQLMTVRGQGSRYTRDVPFYVNMYDLFPNETEQLFNGMIRDAPEVYMPRVQCTATGAGAVFPFCPREATRLTYMDFYRGDCSPGSTTCRPDPAEVSYRPTDGATANWSGSKVLDAGGSIQLQIYAAMYGLAQFPVFFDTTFENQLYVCVEGQGDCHVPDSGVTEGTDYVRHTSYRLGRTFLAFNVRPAPGRPAQQGVGFSMVKEARDLSFVLTSMRKFRGDFGGPANSSSNLTSGEITELTRLGVALPPPGMDQSTRVNDTINAYDDRVRGVESFFDQLIQIERQMGISSYLRF